MRTASRTTGEMTTAARPTVRFATPEDLPGIVETLELSFDRFPPWPTKGGALGYVEWITADDGIDPRPAVAVLEGKVVGVTMLQLRPALVRGSEVVHGGGPYTAMHPIARDRGFYGELRYFDSGLSDFGVGFSQVPQIHHMREHGEETFVQFANRWSIYARILNPLPEAMRHRWRLATLPGYTVMQVRGQLRHRPAPATSAQVSLLQRCDARFDELWRDAAREFDLLIARPARYLNWRYFDPRSGSFRVHAAEEGDRLLVMLPTGFAGAARSSPTCSCDRSAST